VKRETRENSPVFRKNVASFARLNLAKFMFLESSDFRETPEIPKFRETRCLFLLSVCLSFSLFSHFFLCPPPFVSVSSFCLFPSISAPHYLLRSLSSSSLSPPLSTAFPPLVSPSQSVLLSLPSSVFAPHSPPQSNTSVYPFQSLLLSLLLSLSSSASSPWPLLLILSRCVSSFWPSPSVSPLPLSFHFSLYCLSVCLSLSFFYSVFHLFLWNSALCSICPLVSPPSPLVHFSPSSFFVFLFD
jgi:hypothetical protein